jgi:hypothetical protein
MVPRRKCQITTSQKKLMATFVRKEVSVTIEIIEQHYSVERLNHNHLLGKPS